MRPRALIIALVVVAAAWLARDHLARLVHRVAGPVDGGGAPVASGGADGGAPASLAEVDLSGRALELSLLTGPPATAYLGPAPDRPADDGYRAKVRSVLPSAVYDPYLARAAGEIAAQAASLGARPPDGALSFLLHSAGAPESTVAEFVLRTNSPGAEPLDRAVRSALAQPTAGSGTLHVGVGEASAEGKGLDRHIVVLTARRPYELDPTPRSAARGTTWRVRGSAPDHRDLTAAVLYPDGKLADVPVSRDGDRFEVDVPTGDEDGEVAMSIDGVGPAGPDKLLQLTVEVGDALPTSVDVLVPPAETDLGDLASAERFAYELLSLDRRRLGAPPLVLDPALSAVARAHSQEMRDRGFFGHRSPTTGLVGDRLRAVGYRSSATGENLALNDSIAEAEASLMASVGHRKNIAEPLFTHVGIGLAKREHGDGRSEWLLTQVFARPVAELDPADAVSQLLSRLATLRAGAGAPALEEDPELDAVARRGASDAAGGTLDGLADRVGAAARPLVQAAGVSAQTVFDLEDVSLPDGGGDPKMTRVGVGVAQDSDTGRVGVVLIVAR